MNTRIYFVQNKVYQKVTNLSVDNSIHLNVEIVKFLKANVIQKDRCSIQYIIQKDLFLNICDMFLENKNKGNLLASAILNFFEKILQNLAQDQLHKFLKKVICLGYDKKLFLAPEYAKDFKKWAPYIASVQEQSPDF